ncbi:MAG: thioredoxin [Alphaproteobacteria bacterium]|nr:MAG: thioredoxin [Alphaproteobacteria bacterium]
MTPYNRRQFRFNLFIFIVLALAAGFWLHGHGIKGVKAPVKTDAAGLPYMTQAMYDDFAMTTPTPLLLEFGGDWCGWCHVYNPSLKRLQDSAAGRLQVYRVDAAVEPRLNNFFHVKKFPTFVILYRGKVVAQQERGFLTKFTERHGRDIIIRDVVDEAAFSNWVWNSLTQAR